jgi:hypothetical protein
VLDAAIAGYRAAVSLVSRVSMVLVSFALAMLCLCVVNFLAQIAMIFLDVVTRLDSSSAAILALWFVTGVFTTIFAVGELDRPPGNGFFRATVVCALAIIALGIAIVFAATGRHGGDPLEFSLMFTNVWVVIAHFLGAGAMALVLRLACAPAPGNTSEADDPATR